MDSCHLEGSNRHQLALLFYGVNCIGESIFFQVVFRFNLDYFFFIRVDFLGLFRLFFLSFGLAVDEDCLGVAGEGLTIELVGVRFIELV